MFCDYIEFAPADIVSRGKFYIERNSFLNHFFWFYSEFTTIVAAFSTYSVKFDCSTTIRASSESRSNSFVMCSALVAACFRMVSFRMCHFTLVYLLFVLSRNPFNAAQRGSIDSSSSLSELFSSMSMFSSVITSETK